jgi:hypothetical protein
MILNAYLCLTVVFDVVALRTLWLSHFNHLLRALFTASFIVKLFLACLEAFEKRASFKAEYQGASLEESSGLYGQAFLWWLNNIIVLGARRLLRPTDLYPMTDDMLSEELCNSFWRVWSTRKSKSNFCMYLKTDSHSSESSPEASSCKSAYSSTVLDNNWACNITAGSCCLHVLSATFGPTSIGLSQRPERAAECQHWLRSNWRVRNCVFGYCSEHIVRALRVKAHFIFYHRYHRLCIGIGNLDSS